MPDSDIVSPKRPGTWPRKLRLGLEADGGGTAGDSAGSNDGTLMPSFPANAPQWDTGKVGSRALGFDGTDDYVTIPNEASFDFTTAMTVAAWIKVASFTKQWQAIVAKGDSPWRIHRNSTADSIAFVCSGLSPPSVLGTVDVNDGQWHHVVGVYDGTALCLYVDGTPDASAASSGTTNDRVDEVRIGENAQSTGRQFHGLIDDVRIYDRALSIVEIHALAEM